MLKSEKPINFLGAVDKSTGVVGDRRHELHGQGLGGRMLVFPSGAGSSVGAYTIYSLSVNDVAPLAMICQRADLTVASGCAVAGIPLVVVDKELFDSLRTGSQARLDTDAQTLTTGSRQ